MMWVASPDNFFSSSFSSGASTVSKKGGEQRAKLIKITYTLFTERRTLVPTGTTHPSGSYKMTAAECTNILSFTKTVRRLSCNKVCFSPLFRFVFSHFSHLFLPQLPLRGAILITTVAYTVRKMCTQCWESKHCLIRAIKHQERGKKKKKEKALNLQCRP